MKKQYKKAMKKLQREIEKMDITDTQKYFLSMAMRNSAETLTVIDAATTDKKFENRRDEIRSGVNSVAACIDSVILG